MADSTSIGTMSCPQCGAAIPSGGGWEMWCEACDWNLEGPKRGVETRTPAERRAHRRAERLHQEMIGDPADRRRHSGARAMTFILALLLHLPAIAFLLGAASILISGGINLVTLVLAALLVGLAIAARPRFGSLPRGRPLLTRSNAPILFQMLDQMSAAMNARATHWMAFDLDFNCSTYTVGMKRRRLIQMGLPLWVVLSPAERIAVLAHEIAHDTNGDLAHGLVVGSAEQILASLTRWFTPPPLLARAGRGTIEELGEQIATLLMRGVSLLSYGGYRLLLRWARRATPRAEYLADEQAARIASPAATISCLDKFCLARPFLFDLDMAAKRGVPDIWESLLETSRTFSPRGHERLRRIGRQEGFSTDTTHPPTALRLDALRRLPESPPRLVMRPEQVEAIDRELAGVRKRLAAVATARYE